MLVGFGTAAEMDNANKDRANRARFEKKKKAAVEEVDHL